MSPFLCKLRRIRDLRLERLKGGFWSMGWSTVILVNYLFWSSHKCRFGAYDTISVTDS